MLLSFPLCAGFCGGLCAVALQLFGIVSLCASASVCNGNVLQMRLQAAVKMRGRGHRPCALAGGASAAIVPPVCWLCVLRGCMSSRAKKLSSCVAGLPGFVPLFHIN